jgi:nucleoside-diphosphate-sugar epimerase
MKKILLVGGTGVLSSAVVAEALRKGMDITIITRGSRKAPQGVNNILCDKDDYDRLSDLLKGMKFDAVIDFLCYHEEELVKSFQFYSGYTNQYFFISSCAVYDTRVGGELNEDSPKVLPMWSYSVEKWASEQRLALLAAETNCKYTIIRPCVTYGDTRIPYGIYPPYGYHWTLCARILAGKPIITWNKGENRCNMMRVEDFAVGVVGVIGNDKAYNEAFNICGDETPSWNEVLTIVEEYLQTMAIRVNVTSNFYAEQLPNRAGEILGGRSIDSFNSNDKIKSVVPEFKQNISIKEGIYRTIDAYKTQNYQHGIDWAFDAETDRIIKTWCKREGISTKDMNLRFVDYLGNATLLDRIQYSKIRYNDNKFRLSIWKIIHRLYKMFNK